MRRSRIGYGALRSALAAVVLVTTAATAATALAQAPSSKVLIIQTEGPDISPLARESTMGRLRAGLEPYPGLTLLDTPRTSLIDEMFELECVDLDEECLGKLARKYQADKLLLTSLERSPGGGITVDLKLYDPAAGRVSSAFRRVEVTEPGLTAIADQGIESLFGPPPPPPEEKGTVQVTANVAGAQVRVGSVAAGVTPFTAEVTPGTYPVVIQMPGYEDFVSRVTIAPGSVATVRGELTAIPIETPPEIPPETPPETPPDEEAEGTPIYKTWWFWTGIGAVVAGGVVATVLLLAPEDRPPTGDLDFTLRPGAVGLDPAIRF